MKNKPVMRNVSEATTRPIGKTRKMRPFTLEQVNQFLTDLSQISILGVKPEILYQKFNDLPPSKSPKNG